MDIVEEIRKDRESGARRLEAEYKIGLMALARRFCHDPGDAEELVNGTFAEVIDHIDEYVEQSAFFAWMCQILTSKFTRSVRRKSNRMECYPGDVPEIEDGNAREAIYSNLDASLLRDAIETLPSDIRKTVVMHYFMDVPVNEIAKVLSISTGTVKWRLHHARLALAAKLGAAAKKPGGKALLLVLALACTAALGAAVYYLAVVGEAKDRGDAATVWTGETSEAASGWVEPSRRADANNASFVSPALSGPFVPSVPDLSTPSTQQENTTMNNTMNNTTFLAPLAALSLAAATPVAAATATFTGAADTPGTSALMKSASWSNGISPNATGAAEWEYLLEGDNQNFRSPASGNVTVYANPFRVGTVGGTVGRFRDCNTTQNVLTFANGLVLANGSFYRENSRKAENALVADVTVTAPESAPFSFFGAGTEGYGNFVMKGAWSSAAGTKITFSSQVSEANPPFRVKFPSTSDLSSFHGTMRVGAKASGKGSFHLLMQSVTMPGKVDVGTGGIFGALDATSVVSVGTLSLDSGARLAIPATSATNGVILVTGSFANAGAVQLDIAGVPLPPTGRTPLLAFAPGCAGTLDAADFTINMTGASIGDLPNDVALVVDSGTLYFSCSPVVTMVKTESDDMEYTAQYAQSAVTNATYWSDSQPVHGGEDYVVPAGMAMRTPFTTGSYVFPGQSLTLAGTNAKIAQKTKNLTITNLVLCGGSFIHLMKPRHGHAEEPFYNMTLDGGTLETHAGGDITVYGFFQPPVKSVPTIKGYTIASEITGDGDLVFKSNGSSTWPNGYFAATGLNTNFAGTIRLTMTAGSTSNADLTPDDIYARLDVADGRNLGGPLAEANPKAIWIDSGCMLRTTGADISLAEPTRGVYVGSKARFNVQEGHALAISSPLAVNGTLVKEGDGELALGGPLCFGSDGTATTPTEGKNALTVKAGSVRALSADAFDGLAITFAEGAKLVVDVDASDSGLARYGIRNVKAATPFASTATDGMIDVELDFDGAQEKNLTVGICTVPTSVAPAVKSMLRLSKPAWRGYTAEVVTAADGENTVISASVEVKATVLIMR